MTSQTLAPGQLWQAYLLGGVGRGSPRYLTARLGTGLAWLGMARMTGKPKTLGLPWKASGSPQRAG